MEYEIGFRINPESSMDSEYQDTDSERGAIGTVVKKREINVPAFMRSLGNMRLDEMIQCPFCDGGSMSFRKNVGLSNEFACDRCEAKIAISSGINPWKI